jgi:hypothetical protein
MYSTLRVIQPPQPRTIAPKPTTTDQAPVHTAPLPKGQASRSSKPVSELDAVQFVEQNRYLQWCKDRQIGSTDAARIARQFKLPFGEHNNWVAHRIYNRFCQRTGPLVDRTWPAGIPVGFDVQAHKADKPGRTDTKALTRLYRSGGPRTLDAFVADARRALPQIPEAKVTYWYRSLLRLHRDQVALGSATTAAESPASASTESDEDIDVVGVTSDQPLNLALRQSLLDNA